ncbi:hypothetical protein GCM10020358_00780 [Amorphoplanes nipponensis]|uniref:Methylamine utilisation protein MauE domain-containing protein n=1 Tax=Actinoplanes nipponensis TaxID=135950 RepID=A0A919JE50_9ACTN|nr:MauE/DoxX family redox-associated membrane protein [Actinoplanes nipponensis]GIE47307.1 hypothetical protein Ani05nite_08410 [Actinoplanes nipponensis]
MAYVAIGCQGLLTVVLLVATASKIRGARALRSFAASLTEMGLVRPRAAVPLAVAVAAAESATLVLLTVPATRRLGFAAGVLLFAVLTAGVGMVLARGSAAACRCFGASAEPLRRRHLVRNAALTGLAGAGLAAAGSGVATAGAIVAFAAGALAGLLVTVLDDVVALFTPLKTARENPWRT